MLCPSRKCWPVRTGDTRSERERGEEEKLFFCFEEEKHVHRVVAVGTVTYTIGGARVLFTGENGLLPKSLGPSQHYTMRLSVSDIVFF